MIVNSNPVAVAPDSSKVAAGFARDDLFTVVLEHFKTDTVDFADIVLPATTQLEHLDIHKSYGHTYVMANLPSIPPVGRHGRIRRSSAASHAAWGRRTRALSQRRRGRARGARWDDPVLDSDWDTLKRDGWLKLKLPEAPFANGGFRTPSGKCEFYSPRLEQMGADPVPDYLPPFESAEAAPDLAARYPLAMISPPARHFLNSTFVNVDSLRHTEGEPHLDIHPSDADARGIAEGDVVRIFNDRGSMQALARITDRARAGRRRAVDLVEEAVAGRQKRERSDEPGTHRSRQFGDVLRLPRGS